MTKTTINNPPRRHRKGRTGDEVVSNPKRSVPAFWWDFSYDGQAIIVQGSYPGGEELMRFPLKPAATADEQIAKAEKLIEDFKSGRKTPNWQEVKP